LHEYKAEKAQRQIFRKKSPSGGELRKKDGEEVMSRDEEEFFAAKKPAPARHVLGEPLDALSVEELSARIEILRDEIQRLSAALDAKTASRAAADAFFKT
jgi:uncharacterized small protein (DUF1192 family)